MPESAPIKPQPFFVVGASRSGTTLLRLMLNRHPRLRIPAESHFLAPLCVKLPTTGTLSSEQWRTAVALVASSPRFASWQCGEQGLRILGASGPGTLAELVDRLFRLETGIEAWQRWGDKTPEYAAHWSTLSGLFPRSRFLHLVRDGRDVSTSLRQRRWKRRTEYGRAVYWRQQVEHAFACAGALGAERCLIVHYEDLVLDTESTLRGVCDFLGEPFVEGMLEAHVGAMEQVAEFERRRHIHDKLSRAPRPEDVERWRREASPARLFLFESAARRALLESGYGLRFPGVGARVAMRLARPLHATVANAIEAALGLLDRSPSGLKRAVRRQPWLAWVRKL